MHARISTLQAQSGKIDEIIKYFQEAETRLRQENIKGYNSGSVYVNRETHEVVIITVWETEADSTAYARSTLRQEVLSKFSSMFEGDPTVGVFEVVERP